MIIGITGTNGSGKGSVVDILKKQGFKHYSAREFISKELNKQNLEITRDNLREVSNEIRRKNGPDFIIKSLYEESIKNNENAVIESIRNIPEMNWLKGKPAFYLLAVDADIKIRYERIVKRKQSTDNITFEEFIKQENKEKSNKEINKQNLDECIKNADFMIYNDGSFDNLEREVKNIIKKLIITI